MQIEFYFDPACPFCWITSRWLLNVSKERDIQIDWKPFSLAMKNNDLVGSDNKTSHTDAHRAAHRIHRLILAVTEYSADDASIVDLYSTFGRAHHVDGRAYDNKLIHDVLNKLHLPIDLAQAADDTKYDAVLGASTDSAVKIAGGDVGVPTIVFIDNKGNKTGFFGPVLQSLPSQAEGLSLWDGLSLLATDKNFYELKRNRPAGDPDTQSTK